MPLAITQTHRDLADIARNFAATRQLRQLTRDAFGSDDATGAAVGAEICKLGWPGMHLTADVGGGGGDLTDLAVIIEQFGAAAAPAELLATTIASATLATLATLGRAPASRSCSSC